MLAAKKIESEGAKPIYLRSLKMASKLISKIYADMSYIAFDKEGEVAKVDVAKIVRQSIDFFSILIEQKNLDLTLDLEPCLIKADPHHCELLVKNLLDNAIKYTPKGKKMTIRLRDSILSVANEGAAIKDMGAYF